MFVGHDGFPTTDQGMIPLVWFQPMWRCGTCYMHYAGWVTSECCGQTVSRLYFDMDTSTEATLHAV